MEAIRNRSIIRWMILLPASIITAVGGYLLTRAFIFLQSYLGLMSDSVYIYGFINIASHALLGYLFVAMATAIAPAGRPAVSVTLFAILSAMAGTSAFGLLLGAKNLIDYIDIASVLFIIAGGGIYLYRFFEHKEVLFWREDPGERNKV